MENKMKVCLSCKNNKKESEFKKDNAILKSCYSCRLSYMQNKNKNKIETPIDDRELFMNEIDNYYLLQYKVLRSDLDHRAWGRELPGRDWIKYNEYNNEIRNVEQKYKYIKNIYFDTSIRNISRNWYNSISNKNLNVWDLPTWDEIKSLEKLYFQVQCYHQFCNKQIKLNFLQKSKLPKDIIYNVINKFFK